MEMKINLGSANPNKVAALKETLGDYERFKNAEIVGIKVDSNVSDQPITLEETIRGAINRAKAAFTDCNYSFGLESGLMAVPYSKTGYMDLTVCAIYDGKEIHLGLSPAWEFPDKKMTEAILIDGLTMSEVGNKFGLTNNPNIGDAEGMIGILTHGHVDRKAYAQPAIHMALIHIDHN